MNLHLINLTTHAKEKKLYFLFTQTMNYSEQTAKIDTVMS